MTVWLNIRTLVVDSAFNWTEWFFAVKSKEKTMLFGKKTF